MSRVESIEKEVQRLSPQGLADFREWFARFDADAWDQKVEADVDAGKLDALAERALGDHKAGRSRAARLMISVRHSATAKEAIWMTILSKCRVSSS